MIPQNNYKSQKVSADLNRIIHYRDIQWAEWILANHFKDAPALPRFSKEDFEALIKLVQPKEEH